MSGPEERWEDQKIWDEERRREFVEPEPEWEDPIEGDI